MKLKSRARYAMSVFCILVILQRSAWAVVFEPVEQAIPAILQSKSVFPIVMQGKPRPDLKVFYSKDKKGVQRFVVLEDRIYETGKCTHQWAIGIHPKTQAVTEIRVIEMKCQHAFPCEKKNYLKQYVGVGPKDLKTLKSKIQTIAKATGTSDLTTDAVISAVEKVQKYKKYAK